VPNGCISLILIGNAKFQFIIIHTMYVTIL
jgi:hypothetical protein